MGWYDYFRDSYNRGSRWSNIAWNSWRDSLNGRHNPEWNYLYTGLNALPVFSNLANAWNGYLEANKRKYNTGVDTGSLANPMFSQESYAGSAVRGSLNQMVGFVSDLNSVYGYYQNIDRSSRAVREGNNNWSQYW